MTHRTCLQFIIVIAGVIGLVAVDDGVVTSVAHAQRPNRDNDDENGDRGGDTRRRGPGGFGGQRDGPGRRRGFFRRDGGGDRPRWRNDTDEDDNDNDRPSRDRSGSSGPSPTEFAQQLVKQRDKNGNMMLEGEELEGLRGREARADANNDNVITVAEIVAAISDRNSSGNVSPSRGSADQKTSTTGSSAATMDSRVYLSSAGKTGAGEKNSTNGRRTYRFIPAPERLPNGLPSWFKSRDRNKDGQVAMSEYSRTWSARMVREFGRYDLNNDGVLTPKEAAGD